MNIAMSKTLTDHVMNVYVFTFIQWVHVVYVFTSVELDLSLATWLYSLKCHI